MLNTKIAKPTAVKSRFLAEKKLIYTGKCLIILSLVVLSSCKKDTVAFPKATTSNGTTPDFAYRTPTIPTFADADGVLTAVQAHNYHIVTVSPFQQDYEYGMAQFTNTTGNFAALTDGGAVTVSAVSCAQSGDFSYLSTASTYSIDFSGNTNWVVAGAGSVPNMTNLVAATIPSYSYGFAKWDTETWAPLSAKDSITNPVTTADFAANVITRAYNFKVNYTVYAKNYTANADSLIIIFNDGLSYNFQKKIGANDSLNFRPIDFWGAPGYTLANLTMQVNAVKYSNVTVGTKKYYYLKMASYIKYWKSS